jgi:hypothetical protein
MNLVLQNSTSTNFIPIALKFVLVEFELVETVLKCAQCIKRSKRVVSQKQIEPKTFFSDNKYRQNI